MRAAKARSAERGESLKALLARAVTVELGGHAAAAGSRSRVRLPLFGRSTKPGANLTNADLERALADADVEIMRKASGGMTGARRNRRRRRK